MGRPRGAAVDTKFNRTGRKVTPQQWKKAEFEEVREHIKRNKGNPVKFLLQVVDGHEFDFVELVDGKPITIKRPASLNTRVTAAAKLLDKILPDLRAHDITVDKPSAVDIARLNTGQLFAYLIEAGIPLPVYAEDADYELEPAPPALPPAQSQTALPSAPMPSIPLAEAALLVPTSDLPAGQDKSAHLDAMAAQSQAWEPSPPADLTSD